MSQELESASQIQEAELSGVSNARHRRRRSTAPLLLAATMKLCISNPGFCRKIDLTEEHQQTRVEIILADE